MDTYTNGVHVGYSVLFLLVFSLCNLGLSHRVHVSIKNSLGNGKIMNIHCQSKDTDLGQQNVTDGNQIGWDFSPNAWGTTLFFCDLDWQNVQQYHFDAYSYQRDFARCEDQCSWLISTEGMYGFNGKTGFWEFMYYWPS
ncbi:hypothetical protein K2173_008937 [Erythroxylum novogranatense]|uniref:S-protein homolog n=1 Tax=Erythroxylum novogranatense TaxID=1862640 RepID=A0AAV8TSC9_9ROSI|nr:hypothetical protein K2173_008937 [Erythroxylum novogranatense]